MSRAKVVLGGYGSGRSGLTMWDHICSDFAEASGKNSHLDQRGSRAPGALAETQGTGRGPEMGPVSPKLWRVGAG